MQSNNVKLKYIEILSFGENVSIQQSLFYPPVSQVEALRANHLQDYSVK